MAGGVSANELLRQRLHHMIKKEEAEVYYPRLEFCTDNGAMIAYAGCQHLLLGQQDDLTIKAKARWSLEDLKKEMGLCQHARQCL